MISGSNTAAVWQFDILESKLLYQKKGTFSERNVCIVRQSYERSVSITVQKVELYCGMRVEGNPLANITLKLVTLDVPSAASSRLVRSAQTRHLIPEPLISTSDQVYGPQITDRMMCELCASSILPRKRIWVRWFYEYEGNMLKNAKQVHTERLEKPALALIPYVIFY